MRHLRPQITSVRPGRAGGPPASGAHPQRMAAAPRVRIDCSSVDDAPRGALEKVRPIFLALSVVVAPTSYVHPTWKPPKKTFAVFELSRGDWSIALKADPE